MVTALKEFAESDRTSATDKQQYDVTSEMWRNVYLIGKGGHMGSLSSLTRAYVYLNLLILDDAKYCPLFLGTADVGPARGLGFQWVSKVCCDLCDGGQPRWLADQFIALYDEKGQLHPMDGDMVGRMKELCKMYFRHLYTYVALHDGLGLDADSIASTIWWAYRHES